MLTPRLIGAGVALLLIARAAYFVMKQEFRSVKEIEATMRLHPHSRPAMRQGRKL